MPEIACPLALAAQRTPDAPALVSAGTLYSYAELDRLASSAARNLRSHGVRRGETVALRLPLSVDYPVLLWGILRVGAIACPLNPVLPVLNLRAALNNLRCAALIQSEDEPALNSAEPCRVLAPSAILQLCPDIRPRPVRVSMDRPAAVAHTSGSSGAPKAALLSYGNLYHNALASNRNLPVEPGDCWLLSLPLYHVSGLGVLFRCLIGGATVAVPEAHASLHESIAQCGVTHLSLVATQLYRLLQDELARQDLARVKSILLGGSAIPETLLHAACAHTLPVYISYGLTEMASQVATSRVDRLGPDERPTAKVLLRDSVRIAADGEILVGGPTRFLGYVHGEILEQPFIAPEDFFATGDLGRLEDNGNLSVLGRKDNMFVSGGENIYPEEIERGLGSLKGIVQAVVVPAPDAEYGQRPVAFVQLSAGYPFDPEAWIEALTHHLPRFKIPRTYLPWPEDTSAANLKVNRKQLIRIAEASPPSEGGGAKRRGM